MSKDLLLQCMHEAAAQHRTPLISPISLQSKTKVGFNFVEQLWYGRSWPQSQSERENQIWSEKRILSYSTGTKQGRIKALSLSTV